MTQFHKKQINITLIVCLERNEKSFTRHNPKKQLNISSTVYTNIGPCDHGANIGPYVYLLFLDFREQILQQENAEEL